MNTFRVLLAIAVVFAITTAFRVTENSSKESAYVLIDSRYVPMAGRDGQCVIGGDFLLLP